MNWPARRIRSRARVQQADMIARVSGELAEVGPGSVVVMAGGIGYQLFIGESLLNRLPDLGSPVDFYTKQVVRENEIAMYGFTGAGERRLFELLLSVSGLGPRLALALVGAVGEESVVAAVLANDWKVLTRAHGVGAKLAQRVCMELHDKVREESLLGHISRPGPSAAEDVIEALIALGHRRPEAERAALAAVAEAGGDDPSTLIPLALKHASR